MDESKSHLVIDVPKENDQEVIFKLQNKRPEKIAKKQTFRSFTFGVQSGCLIIKEKKVPLSYLFKVLVKNGLPNTIPIFVDETCAFSNFDFKPIDVPYCPTAWDFKWTNINCSITGNNNGLYCIRVYNLMHGIGEDIMKEIFNEVYQNYNPPVNFRLLQIYQHESPPGRDPYWNAFGTRMFRDMDTMYLDDIVKNEIIQNLEKFMVSSNLYDRFGVVWKYVHLFHGKPACGKTSFVAALATKFNKSIAKLEISNDLDSRKFAKLIQSVPDQTFLLIEDIDALFVERKSETMISFSSLLNCLDGIATKRGLIVFLTTNHIERLDEALIRPGRVDSCIEFKLPGRQELKKALKTLGSQYHQEHETYLDRNLNISIACLQQHLFHCIMTNKLSIL